MPGTMDLAISTQDARPNGDGGMRLLELEEALASCRLAGALDTTRIKVETSQFRRVKSITAQIRPDDERTMDEVQEAPTRPHGAVIGAGGGDSSE